MKQKAGFCICMTSVPVQVEAALANGIDVAGL
jgi:hypothetical protein